MGSFYYILNILTFIMKIFQKLIDFFIHWRYYSNSYMRMR